MMRLTDVVKNLIIINVIMYFGTALIIPDNRMMLAFHFPEDGSFQPFQIISHMFMHASDRGSGLFSMHLLFNMIGLYFFGPPLESLWGPKRFLFYYLFAGLGALALHVGVGYWQNEFHAVLGASGALTGLLAGFAYNFPNQKVMLLIPPIPMKAKYFVLVFAGLDLFLGLSGANTGIAHFAHLGGAIFGFLLMLYWQKFGSRL